MKISTIVFAVLFSIATAIAVFAFIGDLYAEDGYDIDLSSNPDTAALLVINTTAFTERSSADAANSQIFNNTVGQPGAEINSGGEITEGDLIAASGRALTNVPSFLSSFFNMISASLNVIGVTGTSATWFVVSALFFAVAAAMIAAFMKWVL